MALGDDVEISEVVSLAKKALVGHTRSKKFSLQTLIN